MSKTYFKYLFILCITLTSCKSYLITDKHYNNIKIKDITTDSGIYNFYKPYKDSLDKLMLLPIATLAETATKQQPSSSLGNLIADILYTTTQQQTKDSIDFAVTNYGGIRVSYLLKGTLRIIDAYNLMPFENYIGILKLNGNDIKSLCDLIAQQGGWPISKQLSFQIKNEKAINIMIKQKPLQAEQQYNIAIIDYLVKGGDNMSFLNNKPYTNLGILLRDTIIDFLKKTERPIIPSNDKRIQNAE